MPGVFRADVVGSMLRPAELVSARAAYRAGQLDAEAYRALEDRAVDHALKIQADAGLDVATDGEMRRDIFFGFFVSAMEGVAPSPSPRRIRFRGRGPEDAFEVRIPFTVVERIRPRACPAVAEFAYASRVTRLPLKVTLPSPLMMLGFWGDQSRDAYPRPLDLVLDAARAVTGWVREVAGAGCPYIQIDAPELAELYADERVRAEYAARGIPVRDAMALGTELLGELAAIPTPGARKGLHVCKGNGTRSWIAEGGYEAFSAEVFRRAGEFDVFHLEYDDERSGGFEPLRNLDDGKVAVLGLVSTKWPNLEAPDALRARIDAASRFHPRERLALATQCGFASAAETATARKMSEDVQRAKLRLVADVARSTWG